MVNTLLKHVVDIFFNIFDIGLGSLQLSHLNMSKQFLPLFLGWGAALHYLKKFTNNTKSKKDH